MTRRTRTHEGRLFAGESVKPINIEAAELESARALASPTRIGSRSPDELNQAFLIVGRFDGKWLAIDEQELVALGQLVRFVDGAHHHIAAQADQQQLAMKAK